MKTAGTVSVADPDLDDTYDLQLNDERFEVVDGILKLKDDVSVDYDLEPSIFIEITATKSPSLEGSISDEIEIPVIQNDHPWQNHPNNNDVDNDGIVEPQDALIILNELNENGLALLDDPFGGDFYLDVNGDGLITPLDALIIVNELNTRTLIPATGEGESQPDRLAPEGEWIASDDDLPSISSPGGIARPAMLDSMFAEDEDWLHDDSLAEKLC